MRAHPLLAVALSLLFAALPAPAAEPAKLYQVSTIDALLVGLYDGTQSFAELRRHGDFGIGTLDHLDGEMVALDGRFYQVTSDGRVHEVPDTATTPFATVSRFQPDAAFEVTGLDLKGAEQAIDGQLPSRNLPYAIRIEGRFKSVRTRSVPRQEPPYPPLAKVAERQAVFDFQEIDGVMVGYRLPGYFARMNVPGYHLHFLSAERSAGGHVLAFTIDTAKVAIEALPDFEMALPQNGGFAGADLNPDRARELNKVER